MVRRAVVLTGLIVAVLASASAVASAASPALSLSASPNPAPSGQSVTLSGQITAATAGSVVLLYEIPYPFSVTELLSRTTTASDGSFSFVVFPDREVRYRAVLEGTNVAAMATVEVEGRTVSTVKALSLGRAAVTILVYHPKDLRWGDARVH
jgi:hypothetical protein